MKIGIDARAAIWYRGTGIGTYTYQLIHNLKHIDEINDYHLFWPDEQSNNEIVTGKNFYSATLTAHKNSFFWEDIAVFNQIKDLGTNIYHVPQNGVGLPDKKVCPYIITLHDVIPYKLPETVGPRYLEIFLEQVPKLVPLCDAIITVSEYSKQDICNTLGVPPEKVFVTHLAPEEIYKPLDKDGCKKIVKENYNIDKEFILYVGGFSPRKNIESVIQSFARIKNKLTKPHSLVIAGKLGRNSSELEELAQKLGVAEDIILCGYVPVAEMPYLYNAAKLFVYPSLYEGFGLPPLEAMACGTPVITSNVTSIPEVIKDGGLMIDPLDIERFSTLMHFILEDEVFHKTWSKKALNRASQFSWKKTALETLSVYYNVKN